MKEIYNKELDCYMLEPETPLEAVESLEEFLCTDFGQKDWSVKFLRKYFQICKKRIIRMGKK